jgi:O-antigen ligase
MTDWARSKTRRHAEDFLLLFILLLLPFHQYVTFAGARVNLSFADPLIALVFIVVIPTSQVILLPDLSQRVLIFLTTIIFGTVTLNVLAPHYFNSLEALLNLLKLSGSVAWFLAVAFLLMRDPSRRIRIAVFTIVGISALTAILSLFNLLQGTARVTGLFENPNIYVDLLMLSFYLTIFIYKKSERNTEETIVCLALLSLFATIIVGTQSRAGLGAFIISLCFYVTLQVWKRSRQIKIREVLLLSATGIFILTAILFSGTPIDRYVGLIQGNIKTGGRLATWSALWEAFLRSPIFGIGIGQTENIVAAGVGPSTPHNTYIRFLGETGIIGFAALGGIIVEIIKSGFRGVFGADVHLAPVFAYLCSSLLNGFFHGIINFRSLWVGIGIFITLYHLGADNGEGEDIGVKTINQSVSQR